MSIIGVKEYTRVSEIRGPLIIVEGVSRVAYDEVVEVELNPSLPRGRPSIPYLLQCLQGRLYYRGGHLRPWKGRAYRGLRLLWGHSIYRVAADR